MLRSLSTMYSLASVRSVPFTLTVREIASGTQFESNIPIFPFPSVADQKGCCHFFERNRAGTLWILFWSIESSYSPTGFCWDTKILWNCRASYCQVSASPFDGGTVSLEYCVRFRKNYHVIFLLTFEKFCYYTKIEYSISSWKSPELISCNL